jgi:hypothetical protein
MSLPDVAAISYTDTLSDDFIPRLVNVSKRSLSDEAEESTEGKDKVFPVMLN